LKLQGNSLKIDLKLKPNARIVSFEVARLNLKSFIRNVPAILCGVDVDYFVPKLLYIGVSTLSTHLAQVPTSQNE
jgi:hypothetical protein